MSEQSDIKARLEEVGEIVNAIVQLDGELRQAAGANLGKVEHVAYIGLTAQAALLGTLRQTLGSRMEMLQKALADEPAP